MKELLLVLSFILTCTVLIAQELNTADAIDNVIRKIHWKNVKKVKLGQGKKDLYARDKNSARNYAFLVHSSVGATEYIYFNDTVIRIKHYAYNLPGEKSSNLAAFAIYKGEVIYKSIRGREVSPLPFIKFSEEFKEEAKKIIFQTSEPR